MCRAITPEPVWAPQTGLWSSQRCPGHLPHFHLTRGLSGGSGSLGAAILSDTLPSLSRHRPCAFSAHFSPAVSRFFPRPSGAKTQEVRSYLYLFWSIEHFLSLFNIFQISGDCFPPLDVVWGLANSNTRRLPVARGGVWRWRADISVQCSSSWADGSPLIITKWSLIFPKPSALCEALPAQRDFLEQMPEQPCRPQQTSNNKRERPGAQAQSPPFSLSPGPARGALRVQFPCLWPGQQLPSCREPDARPWSPHSGGTLCRPGPDSRHRM